MLWFRLKSNCEVPFRAKGRYWEEEGHVWNKAGIVGVGDSYYYGEKSRTEIKSEIGKEHPLIELQMPKGILENVGGLVKSQQSNSDVF